MNSANVSFDVSLLVFNETKPNRVAAYIDTVAPTKTQIELATKAGFTLLHCPELLELDPQRTNLVQFLEEKLGCDKRGTGLKECPAVAGSMDSTAFQRGIALGYRHWLVVDSTSSVLRFSRNNQRLTVFEGVDVVAVLPA